jgi:hypothetical protein
MSSIRNGEKSWYLPKRGIDAAQEITAIFDHIAGDSIDAAERVLTEIYDALKKVAQRQSPSAERDSGRGIHQPTPASGAG